MPDTSPAPGTVGEWGLSSVDRAWIQYCNRDCNTAAYPASHVQNIVSAVIWLKFASTARDSLPSMPSTEITNGGHFLHWSLECLPYLYLLIFSHQYRSATIWVKSVGIRISVAEFDENYGVRLPVSYSLNHYINKRFQSFTPLMDIRVCRV